jgi:hypothetical protein
MRVLLSACGLPGAVRLAGTGVLNNRQFRHADPRHLLLAMAACDLRSELMP